MKCMSEKSILEIESTVIHVRLMAWRNRYKQSKSFRKDKARN